MGSNLTNELAGGELVSGLRQAIAIQLQHNHYPPVPLSMVNPCIEALNACDELDNARLIELPKGVLWRGNSSAPAYAIIEAHHLESWLADQE